MRPPVVAASALALVLFAAAPPAGAQEAESPAARDRSAPRPPDAAAEAPPADPPGTYGGVSGEAEAPKPGKAGRAGRHPRVLWVGFRARPGGGARLFVQLDRELAARQAIEGGKLVIELPGARVAHKNELRWLDTRYFDASPAKVDVQRKPRGLRLTVTFKDGATPAEGELASSAGKDGMAYVTVDFPAFAPVTTPPPRPATPATAPAEDLDAAPATTWPGPSSSKGTSAPSTPTSPRPAAPPAARR